MQAGIHKLKASCEPCQYLNFKIIWYGGGSCGEEVISQSTPLKPWNSSDERTEPLSKDYTSQCYFLPVGYSRSSVS